MLTAKCSHEGLMYMQAQESSGDAAAVSALMSLQQIVSPAAAAHHMTDVWASPPAQGTASQVRHSMFVT